MKRSNPHDGELFSVDPVSKIKSDAHLHEEMLDTGNEDGIAERADARKRSKKMHGLSEDELDALYGKDSSGGGNPVKHKNPVEGALRTAKKYAVGGGMDSWMMHQASRNLRSEGYIKSPVPGRTDKLPMSVPSGSYILPADIPSALGQGNSQAGGHILQKMFNSGPGGMPLSKIGGGRPFMPHLNMSPQRMPKNPMGFDAGGGATFARYGRPHLRADHNVSGMMKPNMNPDASQGIVDTPQAPEEGRVIPQQSKNLAEGGDSGNGTIPIVAAGGEFVIHPDVVRMLGAGDIKKGHAVLDQFVLHTRREHIKTLRKLKPPKR